VEWKPISAAAMRELLAEQLMRLDDEVRPIWERYGIAPAVHIQCLRRTVDGSQPVPEPMYCVARTGNHVLIYDDVEEEFGAGVVDPDGLLREWGIYGEELRWSLRHFPETASDTGSQRAG
jgi:hypothetical protein